MIAFLTMHIEVVGVILLTLRCGLLFSCNNAAARNQRPLWIQFLVVMPYVAAPLVFGTWDSAAGKRLRGPSISLKRKIHKNSGALRDQSSRTSAAPRARGAALQPCMKHHRLPTPQRWSEFTRRRHKTIDVLFLYRLRMTGYGIMSSMR